MGADSKIEWTHHTFNPWIGCTKVSAGCANCYAETLMDKRWGKVKWGPSGTRQRTSDANWGEPFKWDKAAAKAGERHRVFCASLADVFEDRPELVSWRRDLFDTICRTPNLDWLLLTKRPENALRMMVDVGLYAAENPNLPCPQPNLWIGTSVEDQAAAEERIPHLMRVPAVVRFLSMEPLIGDPGILDLTGIHWVIVGGESGHDSRPMDPTWVDSIQEQCEAAGVAFFFKQWGEWQAEAGGGRWSPLNPETHPNLHNWDHNTFSVRVGKKAAGRMLHGREWNEFPKVAEKR